MPATRLTPPGLLSAFADSLAGNRSGWMAAFFLLAVPLGGCASIGAAALSHDNRDYGRAITQMQDEQMLLNIVRLRYADAPSFLSLDRVIAARTLETTVNASGTVNMPALPSAGVANNATLAGTVDYSDSPTFTFMRVHGKRLTGSFLRPLAPNEFLALAQNGQPIDVLFRLCIQSVGRIENNLAVGDTLSAASPHFFKLIDALRVLQETGSLSFRFAAGKDRDRVYLSILDGNTPASRLAAREARSLLRIGRGEAEIVYGRTARGPRQIAVLTRSVLGILTQVSTQIEVPEEDIRAGRTFPPAAHAVGEGRPLVVVHTAPAKPAAAFAAARYKGQWFWIADNDLESKVAFSVMHALMTITEKEPTDAKGPVLAIPSQ